jgi:predicted nucleotidyltransferase
MMTNQVEDENFGLSASTIDKITSVFENYPEIEKAILYGSRAKGNYRKGSDIDITLEGEKLTISKLFKIENELDDLLLPYMIDLSIYHKLKSQGLIEHIQVCGKELYAKVKA